MSNYAGTANSGRSGGSFLGFPLEGFGFFTSLLLALSSGRRVMSATCSISLASRHSSWVVQDRYR